MFKKEVHQYSMGGKYIDSFPSISEAARAFGIDESTIRKSAIGIRNQAAGYKWSYSKIVDNTNKLPEGVKILCLDIETAPSRAYVWGRWKQNINQPQVISEWFMLSWAAKWLGEENIYSDRLSGEEVKSESDRRICASLWIMLNDANIVVAHNGDSYDIPKIQSRFLLNGLMPPAPYRQVDTLNVAKKQFGFSSNKLDSLATYFEFGNKLDTDFTLWKNCMEGDEESLRYMEKYNKEDVVILEKVYLKLRPYMKGHPNLDMYSDSGIPGCPICGSIDVELEEDKSFYTQSSKFQVFRCKSCGGLSRSKQSDKPLVKKSISAIPK